MNKKTKTQKKNFIVKPIPAQVKSLRFNATTPREEALLIEKNNVKEQMNLIKAHHGGKKVRYTVPQFETGVPCISGKCGNHSSLVANTNIMKSRKNSMYDDDVLDAKQMKKLMKKGGKRKTKKANKKSKRKTGKSKRKTMKRKQTKRKQTKTNTKRKMRK